MTERQSPSENTSVAAILVQRNREDRDALMDELVGLLAGTVPGVQIERTLFRRRVKAIRLPLGDEIYVLARASHGSFEASRQHSVRGVVVRTDPMPLDAFLSELGSAIDAELRRTEAGRNVLQSWLSSGS